MKFKLAAGESNVFPLEGFEVYYKDGTAPIKVTIYDKYGPEQPVTLEAGQGLRGVDRFEKVEFFNPNAQEEIFEIEIRRRSFIDNRTDNKLTVTTNPGEPLTVTVDNASDIGGGDPRGRWHLRMAFDDTVKAPNYRHARVKNDNQFHSKLSFMRKIQYEFESPKDPATLTGLDGRPWLFTQNRGTTELGWNEEWSYKAAIDSRMNIAAVTSAVSVGKIGYGNTQATVNENYGGLLLAPFEVQQITSGLWRYSVEWEGEIYVQGGYNHIIHPAFGRNLDHDHINFARVAVEVEEAYS